MALSMKGDESVIKNMEKVHALIRKTIRLFIKESMKMINTMEWGNYSFQMEQATKEVSTKVCNMAMGV